MRILMTTDAVGGVWTYSLELAAALAPHDVEVHLAAMGPAPSAERLADPLLGAVAGMHMSTFALEWEPDPWADVEAAGDWLLGLERLVEPDVVHLNGYAHGCLSWEAPVVSVAHSDVLSWWAAVKGRPAPASYDRYRDAVGRGLRAVDAVCAPTHAALRELRRHVDFGTHARVIHNGRAWEVPSIPKEPFVLGVGRYWDEAKNLAALERVRTRLPWPVVVAGEGAVEGHQDRAAIAATMARAAIFAAPARYEPFGLAILEAALSGCALVLGDIATLRELWDGAARFVDPRDDEELVSVIRTLAAKPELAARLGQQALERARRYTPEAMALRYVDVYGTVLSAQAEAEAVAT
jgi:glycosyltransferase involved in cell wall biosynthesis